jgi:hypothetical protein
MLSQEDTGIDNVSTWEDSIEARFAQQDLKFENLEARMDAKMDKILEMMTRQTALNSSVETPPVSPPVTRLRRLIPSSRAPATPSEDANFRHRFAESSSEERPQANASTFYRSRFSSIGEINQPATNSAIVRSITNIDPTKSGVLLTILDVPHVYRWIQDLEALQKKHIHEVLPWTSFISRSISFRIAAFNDTKRIIRGPILEGKELTLDNEQLINLILQIVLPTTEQDWIDDFKRLVKFRKLDKNLHEAPPDVTRYDVWYDGIMDFLYEGNQVVDFLNSIDNISVAPILRTFSGKPGLMQIFYDLIPQHAGKHLHEAILYDSVKECPSFRCYTVLLQGQNQLLQDGSDIAKKGRAKMNKTWTPPTAERNSNSHPGTSSYKNRNDINTNNNYKNNINNNNRQIVPYSNPHQGRLNNITDYNSEFYNNNDEYDESDDDTSECYDLDEVYGNRNEIFEGNSPGHNVTNTLYNLDRNTKDMPCFREVRGQCKDGKMCKFSHDPRLLTKSYMDSIEELKASKYKPTSGAYTSSNPPQIMKRDSSFRALKSIEKEGQVSNNNNIDISNTNNNTNNNRLSYIQFLDQQTKEDQEGPVHGSSA